SSECSRLEKHPVRVGSAIQRAQERPNRVFRELRVVLSQSNPQVKACGLDTEVVVAVPQPREQELPCLLPPTRIKTHGRLDNQVDPPGGSRRRLPVLQGLLEEAQTHPVVRDGAQLPEDLRLEETGWLGPVPDRPEEVAGQRDLQLLASGVGGSGMRLCFLGPLAGLDREIGREAPATR